MTVEIHPRRRTHSRSLPCTTSTLALSSTLLLGVLSISACAPSAASAPPNAATTEHGHAPDVVPTASSSSTPGTNPASASSESVRPTEAALRRHIASLQRGEPVTDQMTPNLAQAVQNPRFESDVVNLGEVESVVFKGVGPQGLDIFEVTSKTGFSDWRIGLGPDGKTSSLFLRVLEKPPAQPLTQAEFAAEVEKRLLSEAAKDEFSGAVLVARDGKPVFQRAIGLAERDQGIPNQLTTKFRIGSMNKMFTAVATLQLMQAGKLRLGDPIGKYLKDYPNQDVAQLVTIEHLLTHTGGTGDIFGPEFDAHRKELRTLGDYLKLHGKRGLEFTPGSEWSYSNYGFVLLGAVIEKVSGQSYYDYVARHVYAPAGMKSTASLSEDQNVPLRSIGYTRFRAEGTPASPGARWFPNTVTLPYRGSSAGGGYSTVGDLLAFANALEQHRLLDAEHTELLTTVKPGPAAHAGYAYGFGNHTILGVPCFGHDGGAPGMNGSLLICKPPGAESTFVIAVLANLDPPAAGKVADFVRARVPLAPEPSAAEKSACSDLVVDDLEDGDLLSAGSPGTSGAWKSFKDVEGTTLSPEAPFASAAGGANGSKHAAHISGKTAQARSVWAGVELEAQGGTPYDLSRWERVCFRAKGSGQARVDLADVNTTPAGGVCQQCYNNFGAFVTLTPSWQEHCFAFAELTQAGRWGQPLPGLVAAKVYSLAWSTRERGTDYDLWIDDVRLVCH